MKLIKNILKRLLLPILAFFMFFVVPMASEGAIWAQNVGIMTYDAVVFPYNTPAIDKFQASLFKSIYGDRIGICDNTADDVQALAALNAIPAGGGSILFKSGSYTFAATVTRAIDNVDIYGTSGTMFSYNATNAIFSAGAQSRWAFHHFKTDAGGLNYSTATKTTLEDITVNTTYYSFLTTTDVTASSWDIPTGRTATYVIAAYNSNAEDKAQSDYTMPTANADIGVIVNAAYTAGKIDVHLDNGDFKVATKIVGSVSNGNLKGSNWGGTTLTLANGVNDDVISISSGVSLFVISDLSIDANKTNQSGGNGINDSGSGTRIENVRIVNSYQDGIHKDPLVSAPGAVYINKVAVNFSGRYNLYIGLYADDSIVNNNSVFGQSVQHNIFSASSNVIFDGANVYSAGWNGAAYAGDYNNFQISANYNKIINCFINDAARRAISADAVIDLVISNNTIWNNDQLNDAGIPSVYIGTGGGPSSFVFNGNTIKGPNPNYYLQLSATATGVISNNRVDGTAAWGINGWEIGVGVIIHDNPGSIYRGEIRTISGTLVAPIATLTDGTGTFTGSVIHLKPGANTVTCTAAGTGSIVVPSGSKVTVASGTMTVTDTPKVFTANGSFETTGIVGTVTVTLIAQTFAWQNPESQAVIVLEAMVDITTAGGTATAIIDVGGVADAYSTASDLLNNIDANAIAASVSTARIKLAANGGATDWITGNLQTEIADALAGKYYIKYMGQ
jgi:hypothetical protein